MPDFRDLDGSDQIGLVISGIVGMCVLATLVIVLGVAFEYITGTHIFSDPYYWLYRPR